MKWNKIYKKLFFWPNIYLYCEQHGKSRKHYAKSNDLICKHFRYVLHTHKIICKISYYCILLHWYNRCIKMSLFLWLQLRLETLTRCSANNIYSTTSTVLSRTHWWTRSLNTIGNTCECNVMTQSKIKPVIWFKGCLQYAI